MMAKPREKKGITLVALVVTILVLLILVGVSLNLILGEDDGIINRTIVARDVHNRESIREKIIMAMHDLQIDGKETNADNVKADLISSNYYTDNEVEVLSDTKIKINGEVFEIDKINSNLGDTDSGNSDPEDPPTTVSTLQDRVDEATVALEEEGTTPDTKTIKAYLIAQDFYRDSEIDIKDKDDFTDILTVGDETAEVPTNRYTVYFEKLEYSSESSKVYAYVWYDNNGVAVENKEWPGVEIETPVSEGSNIYKYVLPESEHNWEKIIFSQEYTKDGQTLKPQTLDLDFEGKGKVFRTSDSSIIYAICPKSYNSANFKIYAWSVEDGVETKNKAWPGTDFDGSFYDSSQKQTIYYYDMNKNGKTWQNFILNDGSHQTVDITYTGGNRKYCTIGGEVSGKWNGKYVEAYYGGEWVDRAQ